MSPEHWTLLDHLRKVPDKTKLFTGFYSWSTNLLYRKGNDQLSVKDVLFIMYIEACIYWYLAHAILVQYT